MAKTPKQIQTRDIGLKIKRARQETNLSQEEFAKKLGISGAHLGYLETSKRTLKVTMLAKIAEITGKSFDYFLGGEEHIEERLSQEEISAKLNHILNSIQDLRKESETKIGQVIAPIEPILDLTPHALLVIDWETNRCIYANAMLEKITGVKGKDILGKAIEEKPKWLSPETIKAIIGIRKKLEKSKGFIDIKGKALHRNGTKIPVVITERTIRSISGKPIGRLALVWSGNKTYYEVYKRKFRKE